MEVNPNEPEGLGRYAQFHQTILVRNGQVWISQADGIRTPNRSALFAVFGRRIRKRRIVETRNS